MSARYVRGIIQNGQLYLVDEKDYYLSGVWDQIEAIAWGYAD